MELFLIAFCSTIHGTRWCSLITFVNVYCTYLVAGQRIV